MKYLGEGRIQDAQGKVWFFSHVKEVIPYFESRDSSESISSKKRNVLVAVGEKWAINPNSTQARARRREYDTIEIPFKLIKIKKEPFERIVEIIF